ncbi:hypothetical protein Pcinc_036851 [Petrolisthes cinctipes]|uniref:Uncharacterized protein n=1 Tax=Petrolisthes cinctipes TaxID=88211 RepID=A0AAE1ELY6_PETCI|nr:hypothetical protein Pcinc_036851 [Petrolisthes cinctipes]
MSGANQSPGFPLNVSHRLCLIALSSLTASRFSIQELWAYTTHTCSHAVADISVMNEKKYSQRYRSAWENDSRFKESIYTHIHSLQDYCLSEVIWLKGRS